MTVVRVGALTGYQQKYPFGIWAMKGTYNRTGSVGSFNSGSSYVFFSAVQLINLAKVFLGITQAVVK